MPEEIVKQEQAVSSEHTEQAKEQPTKINHRPYSWTRIRTFEECQLKYYKRYVLKEPDPQTEPMFVGEVIHKIIETYNKHLIEKKLETDITFMEDVVESVCHEYNVPMHKFDEINDICQKYSQTHVIDFNSAKPEIELAIKEDGTPCDYNDPECYFRSRLDLLEVGGNVATITDYKSGFSIDFNPTQLKVYCYMVSCHMPEIEIFDIMLDYLRLGYGLPKQFDRDGIWLIGKRIRALTKRIEISKHFNPCPNEHCQYCTYLNSCPMKISVSSSIWNLARARKMAKEILHLEALIERRKGTLSNFCKDNGVVTVGTTMFGYVPKETISVDTEELIDKLGMENALDYMRVDMKKVKNDFILEHNLKVNKKLSTSFIHKSIKDAAE